MKERASSTRSARRARRIARVRAKISGSAERPRIAIRRSLSHIYAQVIDDRLGRTLVFASDADVQKTNLRKADIARAVGVVVAQRALALGITTAVCDRRDKKYHGRVKALVEGARESGLRV